MRLRLAVMVVLCLSGMSLEAHLRPQDYEAVLVPFHGQYASATMTFSWRAEVWIRNESDVPIEMFPVGNWLLNSGGPIFLGTTIKARTTLFSGADIPFNSSSPMDLFQSNTPPGAFLWVKKGAVPGLEMSGLMFARDFFGVLPLTAPTVFPIVPVSRFREGPANILGIWVAPGKRYMVRIYGAPEPKLQRRFRVNVYSGEQTPVLLMTDTLELEDYEEKLPRCLLGDCELPNVPLKPAYAQRFGMPAAPESGDPQRLRVEFIPEDPTMPYWACVSATDNQTNEVTIYTTGN